MLRLTLLLFAGMFAALFTLGENRGQLRPGLELAKSEGRLDEVMAEATAPAVPVAVAVPAATPKPAAVVAEVAPAPAPAPAAELAARILPILASEDAIEVTPGRKVVQEVAEPVFTLSALGNELVPGEDGSPVVPVVAEPQPAAEVAPDGAGTIWYVNASSVNVRAEPSTEAEILGRLGSGEATLLVAAVDDEWARIVIQGDGVEGFVARRFLSPAAP